MRYTLPTLLCCAAVGVISLVTLPHAARAYPRPSVFPVSWELKFDHAPIKRIAIRLPGDSTARAYWYMTFTVTNDSTEEQRFLPVFEMLTKDGKILRSDKDIPAGVFDEIRKTTGRKTLEPMEKITGRIHIGEDQARDGVAIWPEPSTRMGTFHIFVGGLSGETMIMKNGEVVSIKDWTKETEEERKKQSLLHKTLDITYQVPGDEIQPEEDAVNQLDEEWVMR